MVAIACEWILARRAWAERAVASAFLTIALLLSSCSGRPDIAPVQSFYSEGVPHTDRRGQPRHSFDPKQSFLPLAIYHALAGEHHGAQYELGVLSDAGFNVAHLWEGQMPEAFAARAREAGLQVIVHWPKPESVRALAQHPALLAWYLDEEPSFLYPATETDQRFASFRRDWQTIRQNDPETPILVLDGPPTETNQVRWNRWNRAGDITSHFNYPVTVRRLRDYGPVERVAETTTIARQLVAHRKPLWVVLQAFGGEDRGWHMPTPETLRGMAYAAIIHGATGLIYFALDSFVTRDDGILGVSPTPKKDYGVAVDYNADGQAPLVVADDRLQRSRQLFQSVTELNREMAALRSVILSPTSAQGYTVRPVSAFARGDSVRSLLKRTGNGHVMIVVNVDTEPATVQFQFDRPITAVKPLFDSAEPADIGATGWQGTYTGEGVGVYRIEFTP